MKTSKLWIAFAMSIASLAPVHAKVFSYELHGAVDVLADPSRVFESADPGASFDLTYLADFSVGYRNGGGGSFGSSNFLVGGTAFEPDLSAPTIQITPISATLVINGHELFFSGDYFGRVIYTQSFTGEFSFAELTAQSDAAMDGTPQSQITARIDSPHDASIFGSVDTPGSFVVDGSAILGSATFSSAATTGSNAGVIVSGTLSPTAYAVTPAVPESSTAALILIGLLGLACVRIGASVPRAGFVRTSNDFRSRSSLGH